jgi:hypothetical protein
VAITTNEQEPKEPELKPLSEDGVYEIFLRGIYENGLKNGRLITPDVAIEELLKIVSNSNSNHDNSNHDWENPRLSRLNPVSLMRKVHHIAVDLYYDFCLQPEKGAPPLTIESLSYILSLRNSGQSYRQIAIELGLPVNTTEDKIRSIDRIRKQVKTAEKKLNR